MPDKIWDNPVLGTETFFDMDEDEIILNTVQDVEPIIEANKAALNNVDNPRFGDGKRIASIPAVELLKLIQRGILDAGLNTINDKAFADWLNDNDNLYVRTWPGRV
jgi:hypothetical protein